MTTDGGNNFIAKNSGYNVTQFYSNASHPTAGNNYFLAGSQDNGTQQFINANGIVSTNEVTGGDGAYCFIDQVNPNYQITSYIYNNYRISIDGGENFTYLENDNSGRFINPSDYDDNAKVLYSAIDDNSLKRLNNVTGSYFYNTMDINLGATASHIRVSDFTNNLIFVGTSSGRLFKISNANSSSHSAVEITGNSFPTAWISSIELGSSDNELLVTFSNYGVTSIWHTFDGGATWNDKEGDLPDMPVRWSLFNPSNRSEVILATDVGVWSTSNFSSSYPLWVASNGGLANVRVDMFQIRASDGLVTAATYGRGLFSTNDFYQTEASQTSSDTLFYDGFETYADFTISSIGSWLSVDSDGGTTYGSSGYDFENEGYSGSGIIFNPAQTNPTSIGSDFDTYSGDKGMYFFASGANGTTTPNDDWMISPEITLSNIEGCSLSFFAKSNTSAYGLERMRIGISNTGFSINNFDIISEQNYIEVPTNYTKYSYDLSNYVGQTIRFAVNCVSDDAFVLQTDEFLVRSHSTTSRIIQVRDLDIADDEDPDHIISHTPIITFNFYDSMNEIQTSYQVQVSSDSLYSSADMWDSGEVTSSHTAVTYAGTALEDGIKYYLRVKVGAGTFYSDWSNLSFRMNTEPTAPMIVSPFNNEVVTTPVFLKVTNSYDADGDSLTYSFSLYDDVNLTNKIDSALFISEGTDTTEWQVTALLPDNSQYYWTAYSKDGYEQSSISVVGSFLLNAENETPGNFDLIHPQDQSTITNSLPILIWQSSTDPDPMDKVSYSIYFGSTIPNIAIFHTDTSTSYQFSTDLEENTNYFWKVIAEDSYGSSIENTSGYHSFRVNTSNDLPGEFSLISPDQESIITDLTPTLYWEIPIDPDDRSRSIVSYHVYLDTNLTNVIPDTVFTNSYRAPNLFEDAMYYWKITAVDNDGGAKESSTWSFSTNSENSTPSTFSLLTPQMDEETTLIPTFSWTASSDADLYDSIDYTLSYGTDPTSLTDVSTGSVLIYTPDTQLIDNNQYYWYVTARDQSGATYVTSTQIFTVNSANDIPNIFSLISPDSGSMITDMPMLFVWSPTTDLDGDSIQFEIQLNGATRGSTHHNYFSLDRLTEDMTYTWEVIASDNNGGSTQSGPWTFTINTENMDPAPFALLSPTNEVVLNTQSILFEWESSSDSDPMDSVRYSLDIHSDTTDMQYEINTTSFAPGLLMDNSIYHWSVEAVDLNGGVTNNSGGPGTFVINLANDPPGVPNLVAPLMESIQTNLTPAFYWTESIDPDPLDSVSYLLSWWGSGDMGIQSLETDTNSFTPDNGLMDNAMYEWTVSAKDQNRVEVSSDTSYFYTDAFPEAPLDFVTLYPEDDVQGIAAEVEFVWNQATDPDPIEEIHYQLVYATDWQDSGSYIYSDLLEDTSVTIILSDNSEYYWLVNAKDSDGFSVGSNSNSPKRLVVGTLSIDGMSLPEVFALHQNYPNPFNPTTTLRYDLPKEDHVIITIHDLMGRKIKSLVNSTQSPGYRSVRWNATNDFGDPVSAGMYIYTIQAGKDRQTRKMVLLK